jgi:hypothetical protein
MENQGSPHHISEHVKHGKFFIYYMVKCYTHVGYKLCYTKAFLFNIYGDAYWNFSDMLHKAQYMWITVFTLEEAWKIRKETPWMWQFQSLYCFLEILSTWLCVTTDVSALNAVLAKHCCSLHIQHFITTILNLWGQTLTNFDEIHKRNSIIYFMFLMV